MAAGIQDVGEPFFDEEDGTLAVTVVCDDNTDPFAAIAAAYDSLKAAVAAPYDSLKASLSSD